jgi:phage shock protein E
MDWTIAILFGVGLLAFFALQRLSFVSAAVARHQLANGAIVIDVRSREEFQNSHVPNAINIPLEELRESLPRRVNDRNQVLLLHCLSGGRSAMARHKLKDLGYKNVFNLGSLARAKRVAAIRGSTL